MVHMMIYLPNIKKMIAKRDKTKAYYCKRNIYKSKYLISMKMLRLMVNEGFREISIEPVVLEDGHSVRALREERLTRNI